MSFCNNCGASIDEDSRFCRNCGIAVAVNNSQENPSYGQPVNQQVYQQGYPQQGYPQQIYSHQQGEYPYYGQPMFQQELPMKWYKFLVNFSLYFSAFMNFASVVLFFVGFNGETGYGRINESMLLLFDGLVILEVGMCITNVLLAFLCIFVRSKLASFKADGPKWLLILYAVTLVSNIVYGIGTFIITGGVLSTVTTVGSGVAANAVMLVCNKQYFDKRKHLFVN